MSANWKITVPLLALFLAVASVSVGGAQLVGGNSKADLNAQPVKDALQFAVVQVNLKSNALFVSKVTRIIKAQQQVVAGVLYTFTVEMARTSCRKGGEEENCAVHEDPAIAKPGECTFKVWSRPWLNEMMLKENTCTA
ncbi:cystatin C (amyloid angiopathy and cerebral hemorrhage) [Anguilla anguilla]|uniref:cystatin C (amyloid angiopathy and cerebral hemorrhage) n=1 Tax=Anguilla anguilla TaxID=7936 RepID=UPI0015AB9CE3|nr:cystatin C (amyloid angiopathy and cerebral hemorrhage) [Anguilla anguilla]